MCVWIERERGSVFRRWMRVPPSGNGPTRRHAGVFGGLGRMLALVTGALLLIGVVPFSLADAIGRPPTPQELAVWDTDVRGTDGRGLPSGAGTVSAGEALYAERCAACHGEFGEGVGNMPALIGGEDTLASDRPRRTVGSFWPYAPSLFDYVRRAMPFLSGHTLSSNETYALVAYILNLNGIVDDGFVADAESLPRVRMPNRDGFVVDDRRLWKGPRCMHACQAVPRIVRRANSRENSR